MKKPFSPEGIRHYAGYLALYLGHVVRYVLLRDFFNARRSAAMADTSLEFAADFELPETAKKPPDLYQEVHDPVLESIPPEPEPEPEDEEKEPADAEAEAAG